MTLKYSDEIAANLQRAETSIQAAIELSAKGYYDSVASRAYYAATALLLSEELEFGKHSGVIASIHGRFVKTGKLDTEHGRDLRNGNAKGVNVCASFRGRRRYAWLRTCWQPPWLKNGERILRKITRSV